ncbi:uncharacterized protein LOC123322287 isoform X3 [Coccinella septempunctata]|uniref:uncharacterized protein LOC123322287 isoform X2 n=1 Tax=Coccinella septempunctata TaxID=41139 RepID=UPI001D0737F7|nr:uncharacterized protein LOC123322287 isoform X2 [Coccinella septempunctata]XP_044766172.1 uncharacterized protein LOC123322287 isoform X3 [Coccinella septempunctata]
MFAKIFVVALAFFAVAFAAPEPRPQFVIPAASAYSAYSAPLAYNTYSALPYTAYSGVYPNVYGAYQPAVVV